MLGFRSDTDIVLCFGFPYTSGYVMQEHQLYSFAVSALCEDRIFWREDGVPIIRKSWDKAEYV